MRTACVVTALSCAAALPLPVRAQDKATLELKWPPGRRTVQRVETVQSSHTTVGKAPPVQQSFTQVQDFALSVLKRRPEGGVELAMEFLAARMDISTAGARHTIDCAASPASPAAKAVCALMGGKVRFLLDGRNQVEKVLDFDALLTRLTANATPQGAALVRDMFNEDALKQIGSAMFAQGLPPRPVKLGESWPYSIEAPLPKVAMLVFSARATFKGWQSRRTRRCAVLDFSGTLSSRPLPGDVGMTVTIKDGRSTGTTCFDPELGMAVESTVTQNLSFEATLPAAQGGQTLVTRTDKKVTTGLLDVDSGRPRREEGRQ